MKWLDQKGRRISNYANWKRSRTNSIRFRNLLRVETPSIWDLAIAKISIRDIYLHTGQTFKFGEMVRLRIITNENLFRLKNISFT